jgi:hypothetical protein
MIDDLLLGPLEVTEGWVGDGIPGELHPRTVPLRGWRETRYTDLAGLGLQRVPAVTPQCENE